MSAAQTLGDGPDARRGPLGRVPVGAVSARSSTPRPAGRSPRCRSGRRRMSTGPSRPPPPRCRPGPRRRPSSGRGAVPVSRAAGRTRRGTGRLVTREHGKTLAEARASVQRGIEVVEFACGIPSLLMGQALPNIARDVDCETVRHPVGVCVGITPFNFPVDGAALDVPGRARLRQHVRLEAVGEGAALGRPARRAADRSRACRTGVFNIVHGDRECVDALLDASAGAAISFVGSTRGGQARLRDRHAQRQARAGGRRGEEPPDHHARRRPRPGRAGDAGVGVRLRGRAVHGRQRGRAGRRRSPTAWSSGSASWPAR